MQGELENIFRQYKQNKVNETGPIKLERKVVPGTKNQGVPEPLLDGENEPDVTNVHACGKCGSYNISIDMSTNKSVCNDCGEKPDKPNKIDFQKLMEKAKEEEQNIIIEALKRGETFI